MASSRLLLMALGTLACTAHASRPGVLDPEALARRADRVVKARVVHQAQEEGATAAREARIVSRLEISETLKGPEVATLELVQLGSRQGPWAGGVVGDARIVEGEEAIWFLRCRDPEQPGRCTLVGRAEGRLAWDAGRGQALLPAASGGREVRLSIGQLRARVKAVGK